MGANLGRASLRLKKISWWHKIILLHFCCPGLGVKPTNLSFHLSHLCLLNKGNNFLAFYFSKFYSSPIRKLESVSSEKIGFLFVATIGATQKKLRNTKDRIKKFRNTANRFQKLRIRIRILSQSGRPTSLRRFCSVGRFSVSVQLRFDVRVVDHSLLRQLVGLLWFKPIQTSLTFI